MRETRTIRALIVDDEPLARRGVRVCLRGVQDVAVLGECASGSSAIEAITDLAPDLVFLDVQMPGLSGFDVLERVPHERWPLVIFLTAYEEYALRAFDAHALDYLLKPIDDDRFALALDRARQRLEDRAARAVLSRMNALLHERRLAATMPAPTAHVPVPTEHYLQRFAVKTGSRTILIPAEEVSFLEAEGDYVCLHAGGRKHLIRAALGDLEQQLDPTKFVRVHRSTIVAASRVREIHTLSSRDYLLRLTDGVELRMSRNYRERLQG